MKEKIKTQKTSYSMSTEAQTLLEMLSVRFGLSRSATLEMLIRNEAKRQKLKWPEGK